MAPPSITSGTPQNINDPRRPNKIFRYKPSPNKPIDDPTPDYMNLLGMIFSMLGLMMKIHDTVSADCWVSAARPLSRQLLFIYFTFVSEVLTVCWPSIGEVSVKCRQTQYLEYTLKWAAWSAVYCAFISYANARSTEDTKQMFSSFLLSVSAVVMSYLQNPQPMAASW